MATVSRAVMTLVMISSDHFICPMATSCEELTHWKRLWCWEGLGVGGEGDDRGWDGWMASLTWWTWVSVNSGSWWWTGRPGVLRFMGSQRVRHDSVTDLIWSVPGEPLNLWIGNPVYAPPSWLASVCSAFILIFNKRKWIMLCDNWKPPA